jgi:hypothetical protein
MSEIANILNSVNHDDKSMIIDALLASGYGDEAMPVFVKDNNLDGVLENLNKEDLYCMHKTFFQEIKTREDVLEFEKEITDMDTAFDECPYPLFHSFADGMYTREIHFNKGDLIVGAIHKNEYFVNVLKGRIWVVSEFGAKEIIAPASFTAKAGVKHIGFTLEDTVWSDTHKVNSDNVEEAEKEIFADSYEELDRHNNILDFSNMCKDINMDENEVRRLSLMEDLIDQPEKHVYIDDSEIEGKGLFAGKDFIKGDKIALARSGNNRTPAGRYSNHSDSPNSKGIIEGNNGFFLAIKDIKKGTEITINYRDAREKAKLLDGETLCQVG